MSADAEGAGFKQFVSEDTLDEARKKRQEEWEKVRKPEDPQEAPEEEYDHRSLFDRLEEQKVRKQEEFDEKHRLSNQVKGLDDDEAQFLDFVSDKQVEMVRRREEEDTAVLDEYRSAMLKEREVPLPATLAKPPVSQKLEASRSIKKSHSALLAGAVKRKSTDASSSKSDEKKAKTDLSIAEENIEAASEATGGSTPAVNTQTAQVIGVLPGLGAYSGTSDSDSSSDSEIELPPDIFQCRKIIMAHNHDG